jgi:hypothetical protein
MRVIHLLKTSIGAAWALRQKKELWVLATLTALLANKRLYPCVEITCFLDGANSLFCICSSYQISRDERIV